MAAQEHEKRAFGLLLLFFRLEMHHSEAYLLRFAERGMGGVCVPRVDAPDHGVGHTPRVCCELLQTVLTCLWDVVIKPVALQPV